MKKPLKTTVVCALFCAFLCLCSLITVPAAIPFTLQSFAVYLALFSLGGLKTALCTALYLSLGALGLPVFSGMGAGLSALFGATGGFLFGFLLMALFFALLSRLTPDFRGKKPVLAAVCTLFCYACGVLWFALVYAAGTVSLFDALFLCVLPFLLPDALKLTLAYAIARRVRTF